MEQQQLNLYRTTNGFKQNHKTTRLICSNCGSAFLANRKTAKYCSNSCRSQKWAVKNKKRIITLAVPADIDEAYLNKVKQMLVNYEASPDHKESSGTTRTVQMEQFENEAAIRSYLYNAGYKDFKIPLHEQGIYYDEGLSITKLKDCWEIKITA